MADSYTKRYCTPEGWYGDCQTVNCCTEYEYRIGDCSYGDGMESCCTDYQLSLANYEIETNYTWCYQSGDYAHNWASYYQCEDKRTSVNTHRCSSYPYKCFPDAVYCDEIDCHYAGQCDNGTYVCDAGQCPSASSGNDYSWDDNGIGTRPGLITLIVAGPVICCIIAMVILMRRKRSKQKPHLFFPMEQSLNEVKQEQKCENDVNIIGVVHSVSIIYEDKRPENNDENNGNEDAIDNEGVEGAQEHNDNAQTY